MLVAEDTFETGHLHATRDFGKSNLPCRFVQMDKLILK